MITHSMDGSNEMQDEREKRVVCHVSLEHVCRFLCICQCRGKQRNHHLQGWRLVQSKVQSNQLVISNQYFIILTHSVSTLVLIVRFTYASKCFLTNIRRGRTVVICRVYCWVFNELMNDIRLVTHYFMMWCYRWMNNFWLGTYSGTP